MLLLFWHFGPQQVLINVVSTTALAIGNSQQTLQPDHGCGVLYCLLQVCVEHTDSEAADHHCYGGGSTSSSRVSSSSSGRFDSSSLRSSTARSAPGLEWWRSGSRAAKPQSGGLKRAKDSCDSLYTPFAAAAVVAKQAELEQQMQQQHRPSTLGLSSLTKRLSKGLSAAGAAAAAAVSAASPRASLMRAASLHTAGPLTPKAAGLSKALSLKPAASLRRTAAAVAGKDRDPQCQMSVPLMSEHSDEPLSCSAVHRTPPSSPPEGGTASTRTAAGGAQPAAAAAGRRRSSGSRSVSDSDAAAASSSSDGGKFEAAAPAAAAAAAVAVQAAAAVKPLRRYPGLAGQQLAGDSAVELHFMCETLVNDEQQRRQQQQEQQQMAASNAVSALPAVQSFADLAARGTVSSNSSFGALHTLGGEDSCGRINSDCTARISSRTNLLPCSGFSSGVVKGASKLGQSQDKAAPGPPAAAAAVPGASSGSCKVQQQQGWNVFSRFVQRHPLLCHIVWNQAQVRWLHYCYYRPLAAHLVCELNFRAANSCSSARAVVVLTC